MHPCFQATATFLKNRSLFNPFFIPGEEPLNAMNDQLKIINAKIDKRKVYLADGVIRLNDLYDLEVLLLETSSSFQNKDERKISFDNVKGMFALLAMMNSAAEKFNNASVELFKKLKLYLVQASGK
jgi:hypothetical protein